MNSIDLIFSTDENELEGKEEDRTYGGCDSAIVNAPSLCALGARSSGELLEFGARTCFLRV